jgi:hypothetical protein
VPPVVEPHHAPTGSFELQYPRTETTGMSVQW